MTAKSKGRKLPAQAVLGWLFVLPATAFMATFVAYPIFDTIRLAFSSVDFFSFDATFTGLTNFADALGSQKFWPVLSHTVVWTVWSLLGQFALGLAAALAINTNLPGMAVIRTVLLLPYVVPVIALALFWRWMLDGSFGIASFALQSLGMLAPDHSPLTSTSGAMVAVIIANVWRGFPFVMISYWAALQSIPEEQYESARVDGASAWQQFRYITLPHLAGVTKTLFVLRLIWTATFFDIVWLISSGGPAGATEHWPIWIFQETMGYFRFGMGAALSILLGLGLLGVITIYGLLVRPRREP